MPSTEPRPPHRAPGSSGAMRKECVLIPLTGDGEGTPVEVRPLPYFIGRHEECNMVLPGDGIMRKHAKIRQQDGDFFITDLATYHGTHVNGQSVVEGTIREGDIIRIGTHKLRVQVREVAASPAETSAGAPATPAMPLGESIRQLGAGPWIALVLAGLALAAGVVFHQRWQERERIRTQVIDLDPVALVEGASRVVEIPRLAEAVSERPTVAGVEAVPGGVALEAINEGTAKITCTVPGEGTRRFDVTVSRAPSPIDRWPELRGVLALGPYERTQKAQGYADEAARLYAAREAVLANRWEAQRLYGMAHAVLETLPQKTTLLETVRSQRIAIERELDSLWETHYSQLKQATGVRDGIRAREEAYLLTQLFPIESGQRHSIARVYLDFLR